MANRGRSEVAGHGKLCTNETSSRARYRLAAFVSKNSAEISGEWLELCTIYYWQALCQLIS